MINYYNKDKANRLILKILGDKLEVIVKLNY